MEKEESTNGLDGVFSRTEGIVLFQGDVCEVDSGGKLEVPSLLLFGLLPLNPQLICTIKV